MLFAYSITAFEILSFFKNILLFTVRALKITSPGYFGEKESSVKVKLTVSEYSLISENIYENFSQ